jgi:hypothetical protein
VNKDELASIKQETKGAEFLINLIDVGPINEKLAAFY